MTETKHTPGPWMVTDHMGNKTVQAYHPHAATLPSATGYINLATPAPFFDKREAEANAALIAAPELLEALERSNKILERLADNDELPDEDVGVVLENRAAIAKATGKLSQDELNRGLAPMWKYLRENK